MRFDGHRVPATVLMWSLASIAGGDALADGQPLIQDDWQCGSKVEPSAEIAAFFEPDHAFGATELLPTFVAGTLKDPQGGRFSMIFHRQEIGWAGYAVEPQAGFWNAYVSGVGPEVVLFSAINVEGPGQEYTVVTTRDGFETITCGTLPAPDTALGTLDYMSIEKFELDAAGAGRIEGIVSYSDSRPADCFVSTTRDAGRNWSVPSREGACIESVFQELKPIEPQEGPVAEFERLKF